MATKREHVKVSCPFCSWCRRSFHLPDHLLTHHADTIQLRPVTTDHCVYAYVLNKKKELGFCACLTCKKGILDNGVFGNGSRWVELHAKSADCKKAHKQRFSELKHKIGEYVSHPAVPVILQVPVTNTVSALWDKLKAMPQLAPFMKDIEIACQESYEFDSDNEQEFVFDAADGFHTTVTTAIGYRREATKLKDSTSKMEDAHESEIIQMQADIYKLNMQVTNLLEDNKQLNQRVRSLERENGRYKSTYPLLPVEDPQ
jgi:uncharacterized membrane protein